MTISSVTNRNDYTGNGAVDTYAYSFKIFAESHLLVTVVEDATGDETTLSLTTHYTVTGVGETSGGNVALVNGAFDWIDASGDLDTGWSLTIRRVVPITQLTDIRNQGDFYAEAHEDQFDLLVMIDQQQQNELDRTPKFSETSDTSDIVIPEPEADKAWFWNALGTAIEYRALSYTSGTFPGSFTAGVDASKAASPSTNDVYIATDTKIVYVCFASGTWTVTSTLSGADASKPASPIVGQSYFATDTFIVYRCVSAGSWTTKQVFSHAVNFAKGSDIASATTTDIGAATGNCADVTGTTTITGLGTVQAGTLRWIRFTGALTLTHNATSLILPASANITTAANDCALFESLGSGNWICHHYQRASGLPILSGLPKNYMDGGIISNNVADATNDLDMTATVCRSDDDAEDISVIAMTKRIDATFVAGTNQGFLDTSTIGASEDLIYIYAIKNPTTGATDYLASKSATAPTMPSGYTKKRLLGGRRWDATAWSVFVTSGNGRVIDVWYKDPTDADQLVLNGGTANSATDVDCGDGGAELIPTNTFRVFIGADIRSDTVAGVGTYFRRNGDTGSMGDGSGLLVITETGTTTPRTRTTIEIPVDSDGIFEYQNIATSTATSLYVRGYREVR